MKLFEAKNLLLMLLPFAVQAFDYGLTTGEDLKLSLLDTKTGIGSIKSLFINEPISVTVEGIEWEKDENGTVTGGDYLFWTTKVDGKVMASGNVSLADIGRELPSELDAGSFSVSSNGKHTVEVEMTVDASDLTASGDYQGYKSGVSIIPLLVVLVLAVTTKMVEISLLSAVFVGACIVTGGLKDGFKATLDTYILDALKDEGHCFVFLFTLFLSGLVGMMEKSGGMFGFTKAVGKWAKSSRTGQLACFGIGVLVFFDDYANVLLAGETMRPLLDSLFVSREKLAFIVDATAAPIASISPISSWVGFEVDLIQTEIDRIIEIEGTEDIGIKTSGLGVFLQSIKYRYYPIFMIVLMLSMITLQRDFGGMLVAERKTAVYRRTDGGDGKGKASEVEGEKANQPSKETPLKAYNMLIPIALLVVLIFYCLVKSGESGEPDQDLMGKIESSDSYVALLYGTMGATLCTLIFYLLQWFKDGKYTIPNPKYICNAPSENIDGVEGPDSVARPLMSIGEATESFLHGMGRIFPALIVLTLAWASGAIMVDVGADRLFSRWIVGGIKPEALPTLSFIISLFMALATGTSWGTMTIMFPLILVPTYQASGGDETIFYAVTAGILSGSVAGDHVSPISDTTVLSALACDCNLLSHVSTQAPYVIVTSLVAILLGTVPIGYDAWPNIVGILIGFALIVAFVYFVCVPVVSSSGKYDIFTELILKLTKNVSLDQLRRDTIVYAVGGRADDTEKGVKSIESDDIKEVSDPGKMGQGDSSDEEC